MVSQGRVVGGHYLNAIVSPIVGSTLVVQAGLKWRKLNDEQVATWQEVPAESHTGTISAVGQAVASAVVPRVIRKTASAAVGAVIDTTMRARFVRVDWADGKQSLLKLPENLFTHFELILEDRRVAPDPSASTAVALAAEPEERPSLPEQALTHASELLKDRLPGKPDVAAQLQKLADLRDAGILTDEEFAAKKTELLARL